jgi:hypothetical protein
LADALTRAAPQLGLGNMEVSVRQVRRWESGTPPWPHPDHQRLLIHVLNLPIEELGFIPPWTIPPSGSMPPSSTGGPRSRATRPGLPLSGVAATVEASTISADYAAITAAHRRLYFTVQPAQLYPAVMEHSGLGTHLLTATTGTTRRILAAGLSESLLLAGRIEFFDLRRTDDADATFLHALQAAGAAEDPLLGAAILAHAAFVPGWSGRRDDAAERVRAARVYARRGTASAEFRAWLDAVEAECETHCGHTQEALRLIGHAEDSLASPSEHASPEWFDWFSPVRLAAFKGNTELEAGYVKQARVTLTDVLDQLSEEGGKQHAVILGDLAAVEAAEGNPEAACTRAEQALDLLASAWYATAMDRIRKVRRALQAWADHDCVRRLDDRLYDWETTFSALRR